MRQAPALDTEMSEIRRTKRRHLVAARMRRIPTLPYVPPNRTLHVVDIENEAGGTAVDGEILAEVLDAYMKAARFKDGDHLIVGCNPTLALAVKSIVPGAQVVHRHGPDGADLALLGAVGQANWIAERYHRVVIGSGDHVFADLAAELVSYGVPVSVVSRTSALSYRLYCLPGVAIIPLETQLLGSVSA